MLFCCDYLIVWALVITALSWWVSGSLCYPYKLFLDRVYLLGWLRQLGENPEPKKTNWINKHIWLPRMHLWCTVDSPRFFEAHQDDSDKVENDKSLQKYKDGINSGCVIGDASLEEMELKLNFRFWSIWAVMMHILCLVWNINVRDNPLDQSM